MRLVIESVKNLLWKRMSIEELISVFILPTVIAVLLIRPFVVRQTEDGRSGRTRQGRVLQGRSASKSAVGTENRRARYRTEQCADSGTPRLSVRQTQG